VTANPFIEYRARLDSYRAVAEGRLGDERFVELVDELDEAVAGVDRRPGGRAFTVTPLVEAEALAAAIAPGLELVVKDETGNVAGSHKARHLFGTAIALRVDEELGGPRADRLAIASCGNAALAAGVVAAAMGRPLEVFVPTWADDDIVDRLAELGASVTRCPRRAGEVGDPAYLRFREAVEAGARSFSVQGTDTPSAFDGGRTLGWELADQLPGGVRTDDRLFLQVGGGAMATAFSLGAPEARLFPVQADGCAPLRRAWDRLAATGFDFEAAAAAPGDYMWAWESEPRSAATGILDDVTYDWLPLLRRTRASGGEPLVVAEELIVRANELARATTEVPVSTTGSAGLAGLLAAAEDGSLTGAGPVRAIVAFTGVER
jgi:threonine synthase